MMRMPPTCPNSQRISTHQNRSIPRGTGSGSEGHEVGSEGHGGWKRGTRGVELNNILLVDGDPFLKLKNLKINLEEQYIC